MKGAMVLFALGILVVPATGASARTWYILPDGSGDAPTIQAGIDSATVGDTVLVGCGIYYEYNVRMKSGVCLRSETGDPDCATIDAQSLGRVLNCRNIQVDARIEGLTLTGGYCEGNAGGIYCVEVCRVSIVNCMIRDNRAGWGGGIGIGGHSSPTIRDCEIYRNTAFYPYEYAGSGGGVYMGSTSGAVLARCTVYGNSAVIGGGVGCDMYGAPLITDCVITGNTASARGGGIGCEIYSSPTFVSCTVAGNFSARGGGIDFYGSYATLERSIVWGNCAGLFGDEIRLWGTGTSVSVSCSAVDTSGIVGDSLISWGVGNVFEDPLFCGPENCESAPTTLGDYTLSSTSPCLNAPGCGQIGALGLGCSGPTRTEETSWGTIKRLFR